MRSLLSTYGIPFKNNMALKFCANLNFLFNENSTNLLDKYKLAAKAGFKCVEGPYPEDSNIHNDINNIKNEFGLEQVLMNLKLGPNPETQAGCTSLPKYKNEFRKYFQDTVTAAKLLNCKKIHLMSGKMIKPDDYEIYLETYIENLKYAVKILENENIIGVIEPINKYAVPDYFLNNYATAIDVLNKVNSPNLKLMIDLYHLQHICGNVTNSLKEFSNYIGHIQIAQVPDRNEPNTNGELNYNYIFKLINEIDYNDWIGCEYKPKNNTLDGLKWIEEFGYSL